MMSDEQKEALEALEAALAKCKVANCSDLDVRETVRHSRETKMSITLIKDDGTLNELWVNESVEQSGKTLEEVFDLGLGLITEHAGRVNMFIATARTRKEDVVGWYRRDQARHIPKPGRYYNPLEHLFIRTGQYGCSPSGGVDKKSFCRSVPTSLSGSSLDKSRPRVGPFSDVDLAMRELDYLIFNPKE